MIDIPAPPGGYGVIYADPPWTFKTHSDKGKGRSAMNQPKWSRGEWIAVGPDVFVGKNCIHTDCDIGRKAGEAIARRIAQCVNAHDELVAALSALLPEAQQSHDAGDGHFSTAEIEAAKAALARARNG